MGKVGGLYIEITVLVMRLGLIIWLLIPVVTSSSEEEFVSELPSCWQIIEICLDAMSAAKADRTDAIDFIDQSNTSKWSDDSCECIKFGTEIREQCFCSTLPFLHQNSTEASNAMFLLSFCNVAHSLAGLDILCSDASPSPSPSASPWISPPHSVPAAPPVKKKSIAAIIIPSVTGAIMVIIALGVVLCMRKAKRKPGAAISQNVLTDQDTLTSELPRRPAPPSPLPPVPSGTETRDDVPTIESLQYELLALRTATNNFSTDNKLGEGGFGVVYKGTLPNGREVAVKRLQRTCGQGDKEFKNEVVLLAKLRHRYLVKLLGFCLARDEELLVYEFMSNKSLDYFLFDPRKQQQLDWPRRYNIIRGIARGMLYLHEDSPSRIIHRDLKAANVLLDAEMNPKISDFGMARIIKFEQTHISTSLVVGTYGYMAPEYLANGKFSIKSDVYSFGVLVLEIISGKRISSLIYQSEVGENLLSYAWRCRRDGRELELMDPTLRETYSNEEIIRCIDLALLCVQEDIKKRPTMATIVHGLNSYAAASPPPTYSIPQHPAVLSKGSSDQSTATHNSNSISWPPSVASTTQPR